MPCQLPSILPNTPTVHLLHKTFLTSRSKKLFFELLFSLVMGWSPASLLYAQPAAPATPLKIGILLPLYLDSAFDKNNQYRYENKLPAFFNPGLESYMGILAALDTLAKEKALVSIHIFDSRSAATSIEKLIANDSLNNLDILLGHVNLNEAALLSQYSALHKIPFLNINLPNEAKTINNPYYILLNATLATHCQGLYRFLQKNCPTRSLLMIQKKDPTEERIFNYYKEAQKANGPASDDINRIIVEDSPDVYTLAPWLDSTKNNICILGSLDLNFAAAVCRQLSELTRTYRITVVGMPNWETADLSKASFAGLDIFYSNSQYISPDNSLARNLQLRLKNIHFSRTSEFSYRSYESLFEIAHLQKRSGLSLLYQLQSPRTTLLGSWEIFPVINKKSGQADYSENKKLYFLNKTDGMLKAVY